MMSNSVAVRNSAWRNQAAGSYIPHKRGFSFRDSQESPQGIQQHSRLDFASLTSMIGTNRLRDFENALKTLSPADLGQIRGQEGETLLHVAASGGNLLAVDILINHGADLYACDKNGLSPVYSAAFIGKSASVKNLLKAMEESHDLEMFWYDVSKVKNAVLTARGALCHGADQNINSKVDQLASQLTGTSVEAINDQNQIYTYIAHLNSWIGETLGAHDESWNIEDMFVQRIRVICHLLVSNKSIPHFNGESFLYQELTHMLNALQIARRQSSISQMNDGDVQLSLNRSLAKQTINQIQMFGFLNSCALPLGFLGHAFYMGVETRIVDNELFLVFYIVNQGAGSSHHEHNGAGKVFPRAFKIPFGDGQTEEVAAVLEGFFTNIYGGFTAPSRNGDEFYLSVLQCTQDLGDLVDEKRIQVDGEKFGWPPKKLQNSGNCTLKGYTGLLAIKYGNPFCKWFKGQEISYILSRGENLVSKDYFNEKEAEKESAELLSLANRFDFRGLNRFFLKSRQPEIAKGLSPENLAFIVNLDRPYLLSSLLDLGAPIHFKGYNGDTFLHFAARGNKVKSAFVLLNDSDSENRVNARNHEGRTALHAAMEQGHLDMSKLLVDYGADRFLKDQKGITPQDLCEEKISNFEGIQEIFANQDALGAS